MLGNSRFSLRAKGASFKSMKDMLFCYHPEMLSIGFLGKLWLLVGHGSQASYGTIYPVRQPILGSDLINIPNIPTSLRVHRLIRVVSVTVLCKRNIGTRGR